MTEAPQEFTLIVNGEPCKFKVRTFAKVSKKAGQLIRNGIYEARIDEELSEEAATAFIAACNLKQFKVTSTNAFELLDLSVDWKITNLEKFVSSYVATKGLQRPEKADNTDYLELFIEKMQRRELKPEDYQNVAKKFDKYLDDDRLLNIHILPLFRIILTAEYSGINDEKLINLVIKLIQKKPHAAVPLLLRINYEKLTKEQDNIIFDTPEVHDQNFSFFITSSCSAARNKITRLLDGLEEAISKQLNDANDESKKRRQEDHQELDAQYRTQIDELRAIADAQKKQIDDLKRYRERTIKRRQDVADDFADKEDEFVEQRDKVGEDMLRRKEQIDIIRKQIANEISKQVGRVRERVVDQLGDVREADQDRRDGGAQARQDHYDSLKRNVDRMKKNCQMLKAAVKGAGDETDYTKATLAAKMVKDFMRFDNFIRRTEKRFKIFDEKPILKLTGAEVKKAEEDLTVVEKRIDKICPIRHTVAK
ncbi:hypothetical protein TRFO_19090 [Tritrichomonas foetus]|uniref:Uncharacterized protein n=1 Tax=Tritrichomonas foetus TaxID=1144522 RepID=A0A1J4KJF2_9EUKA|nr:hypothetical protein TRFO_19090 [Tritrichomonas foetus]|eukprot:OHT11455.1 hypothetical protein TRFO_19090 [Tritrichomonas foetus]